MEIVPTSELSPGMRFAGDLRLGGGELVLWGGGLVDEILLSALAEAGAEELLLFEGGEIPRPSGRARRPSDLAPGERFERGLYSESGRKLLPPARTLKAHMKAAIPEGPGGLVFEPKGASPAGLARRRRALIRRAASPGVERRSYLPGRISPRPAEDIEQEDTEREHGRLGREAVSEAMIFTAGLASEAEAVFDEAALGFAPDVPRAAAGARSAAARAASEPFLHVACALQLLSGGRLRDHAAASCVMAAAAAGRTGATTDEAASLALAALLHDLGMNWVSEDLLREPGPLSRAGLREVRRHPLRALFVLSDADGLGPQTALAAFQVHERPDGSGYPYGLRGDGVLPEASLLATVDVLCALLAPRPHRGAMRGEEATKLCLRMAEEGALDGPSVRAVLEAVGVYPVGSGCVLSTAELARVVAVPAGRPECPVVSVLRTNQGLVPASSRVLDLSRHPDVRIERSLTTEELPWDGSAGF